MRVDFGHSHFPNRGEIQSVLARLTIDGSAERWNRVSQQLEILGPIDDGRSGSVVLAARFDRGQMVVIKIGPCEDLRREYQGFTDLPAPTQYFTPIYAHTDGVTAETASDGSREALVYHHVESFSTGSHIRSLTSVVHEVFTGGRAVAEVCDVLRELFRGIQQVLYDHYTTSQTNERLLWTWNNRLGADATIEIDRLTQPNCLEHSGCPSSVAQKYPLDLVEAATRMETDLKAGGYLDIRDLKALWWHGRLFGVPLKDGNAPLLLEVKGNDVLRTIPPGAAFRLCGRLTSVRLDAHLRRLTDGLAPHGVQLRGGLLEGSGALTSDPFPMLHAVLERNCRRVTSWNHGDLHPGNIRIVEQTGGSAAARLRPYLIDYGNTRNGEPLLLDFARLEGCLTRDALPENITWQERVRLQRLLAAACRLGDSAATRFEALLAQSRKELASAFELLWTIRQCARNAYPGDREWSERWERDYMEQLFLFAHMMLKWELEKSHHAMTIASIAGVAAETLDRDHAFRHWTLGQLRTDGMAILGVLADAAEPNLAELAAITSSIHAQQLDTGDPLEKALEAARVAFVHETFALEAASMTSRLESDHRTYMPLTSRIPLRGRLRTERERFEADDDFEGDTEALKLIESQSASVLLGDAGDGKTTAAREWQYRLASRVWSEERVVGRPWLPLFVRAADLASPPDPRATSILGREKDLWRAGALYLIVDALNEVAEDEKARVAEWMIRIREIYPRVPLLVCHRKYNYPPDLLPFPEIVLQKVGVDAAKQYIQDYLYECGVKDSALWTKLQTLLFHSGHDTVRDLARTPLFLFMIVDFYRLHGVVPENRGHLFEQFSRNILSWDHRRHHHEPSPTRSSFEEMACVLEPLGYELVEHSSTELPQASVAALMPPSVRESWQHLLAEILQTEMLELEHEHLRFRHQSFQEYFAARRLRTMVAEEPDILADRVRRMRWSDTFVMLLGFAEYDRKLAEFLISKAIETDPLQAGRYVRFAKDELSAEAIENFVRIQQETLVRREAGEFSHRRAARALAAFGKPRARKALSFVTANTAAPEDSRIAALESLSELVTDDPTELRNILQQLLSAETPEELQKTAIGAVVTHRIKDLVPSLEELVTRGAWPIAFHAWNALRALDVVVGRFVEDAYHDACRNELEQLNDRLFSEPETSQIDELNRQRVDILRQLAVRGELLPAIRARFSIDIDGEVASLIDQNIEHASSGMDRDLVQILRVPQTPSAIDQWLGIVRHGPIDHAFAAAHRLAVADVPQKALERLLQQDLSLPRLALAAAVASADAESSVAALIEERARKHLPAVRDHGTRSAFAQIIEALLRMDSERGYVLGLLADSLFWTRYRSADPEFYPWCPIFDKLRPSGRTYELLLDRGGDDTRAVVHWIFSKAAVHLLEAESTGWATLVDPSHRKKFASMAVEERDVHWFHYFAGAAAQMHAVELLPWLMQIAGDPRLATANNQYSYENWGHLFSESNLAMVLRTIGFLSRVQRNDKQDASAAVGWLRRRAADFLSRRDRTVVIGMATALGYAGEWQAILFHLGPEKYYQRAADNVVDRWSVDDDTTREEIVRWTKRHLRTCDVPPEARSTLEGIIDRLEQRLGYRVPEAPASEDPPPAV